MLQYQEMSSCRYISMELLWEGERARAKPSNFQILGNAESKVHFLQAQPHNSNPANESDSFKDQLQKKLCYNLNSGLLFCSLTKEMSEFPPDPLIELITSPWTISQMCQDLISHRVISRWKAVFGSTENLSFCKADLYYGWPFSLWEDPGPWASLVDWSYRGSCLEMPFLS